MAAVDTAIRSAGKDIGRKLAAIPTKSTFLQDGKLIPVEFVAAGLFLSLLPLSHPFIYFFC
jgi:hypothetical protein